MNKKYNVRLTDDEQSTLKTIISKGKRSAKIIFRANVLLKSDLNNPEGSWTDDAIRHAFGGSIKSIERVRKSLVLNGFECALYQGQKRQPRRRKLDGEQEAHLIAVSCSVPPLGRKRWTLRMLATRMIELEYVESVSHETVRKTLKKTN